MFPVPNFRLYGQACRYRGKDLKETEKKTGWRVQSILLLGILFTVGCCSAERGFLSEEEQAVCEETEETEITVLKALEGEQTEKSRELTKKCVVRLDIRQDDVVYYGSALLWDTDGNKMILATAGHLLESGQLEKICFPDGISIEWNMDSAGQQKEIECYIHKTYDVGFLEIPVSRLTDLGLHISGEKRKIALVSLHQRIFDTMDEDSALYLTASTETGAGDIILDAVLLEKERYQPDFEIGMMILQCDALAGMSGGGIFDGYGHLAGMVIGGNGMETVAVSMERINAAYEELTGRKRNTEDYR